MRSILCFGLMLMTLPAHAEDWAAPASVHAEVVERMNYCKQQGGKVTIAETFLRHMDLDGDGRDDFIVDDAGFRCSKGVPLYCGSGGCQIQVFLGGEKDARPVFSELAQQYTLKGKVLEVSQGKSYPKIIVRFEGGCAIRSDSEKSC